MVDRAGAESNPDRIRRFPLSQDLPLAVRQLLLLHLLHRILQGEVRRISGQVQQAARVPTRGMQSGRLLHGGLPPVGYHLHRKAGLELIHVFFQFKLS